MLPERQVDGNSLVRDLVALVGDGLGWIKLIIFVSSYQNVTNRKKDHRLDEIAQAEHTDRITHMRRNSSRAAAFLAGAFMLKLGSAERKNIDKTLELS
uniref:Uncharacterized protein n=1 Tax=Timema cristinae TaxID=61476 RepID=A0A7R9CGK9_TIMCR|nr:unnamed protein product [Timema cristinae]